jgi:hypothetical protein
MSENNPFRKVTTEKVVTKVEVKEVAVEAEPIKMIKVKARQKGFYKNSRIEEGDEFTVPENLYSKIWMQKL